MKSKWIMHKDRKIFFADYSNFADQHDSFKAEIDSVTAIIIEEPENSVPLLVDVRETQGTPGTVDVLKTPAMACKPHVLKAGVVGLTGYQRMILRTLSKLSGLPIMAFDTLDEAKDWLVQ
jgi:hypothetical protein